MGPARAMLLVVAAVTTGVSRVHAQDRVAVVPETRVLLDHECVRVQYHDVEVGQTIPMHSHPSYVVYVLNSFKARITLPDGTQRTSERKAGEAYWNDAITHSVENVGDTPIHNLIVELKSSKSCSR